MGLRILVIPWGHALSHVSRPLRLAGELRARGHEVHFAGGGRELAHAGRAGFPVHPAEEIPADVLLARIRARRLRFVRTDELRRLVRADLTLFTRLRPDVVLTDGRISARLSTRAAGIPHAAIVNVSSTRHRAVPYVPVLGWVRPPRVRRLADRLNLWVEMLVFDAAVPGFRRVARELGLRTRVAATDCLEGNDLTLLPDLPRFMPSRSLPPGHHYIGPLTLRAPIPAPPWWPEVQRRKDEGREILYFTLGTTGTRELFDQALEYFRGARDVVAVVSTGGQVKLPEAPADVFVAEYLDGDAVMELADLVVCHGGNGTLYQALRHGVPVLGFATVPDQAYNLRRAEALGFAMRARPPLTAGVLAEARAWARRTRARLRPCPEAGAPRIKEAAELLERTAARPTSTRPRSGSPPCEPPGSTT